MLSDLMTRVDEAYDPYVSAPVGNGQKLSQMVLASLDKKSQRLGTEGEVFKKEEPFYKQVMSEKLLTLTNGLL